MRFSWAVAGACMHAVAGEHGNDQQHPREYGHGALLRQPLLDDSVRQECEGGYGAAGHVALRGYAEATRAGAYSTTQLQE